MSSSGRQYLTSMRPRSGTSPGSPGSSAAPLTRTNESEESRFARSRADRRWWRRRLDVIDTIVAVGYRFPADLALRGNVADAEGAYPQPAHDGDILRRRCRAPDPRAA